VYYNGELKDEHENAKESIIIIKYGGED